MRVARFRKPFGHGGDGEVGRIAVGHLSPVERSGNARVGQREGAERLEGLEADARTDIFAFGVVLHEMISGRKTFEGKSRVLLMSAIATAEPPPLSTAQPAVSPALDHVVKTCLAKDAGERWQTARDVLAELQWIAAGGADTIGSAPSSHARARWSPRSVRVLAAAAILVAALSAVVALYAGSAGEAEEVRFRVPIQLSAQAAQVSGTNVVFDPDRKSVV